ncbi:MAG: response regulator [candidate division KSB1 bacterium]|nr:response regulator [candidate division KSB1 bacterium]
MEEALRKKILVIEDDAFTRELLEMELKDAGYEVLTAGDGKSGVEAVYSSQPDLVLLDIMMPHIDGLEVLRTLRSDPKLSGLPVILISARGEVDDKLAGLAEGANDYVTKPFDIREVLARVAVQFRLKELETRAVEAERLRAALEMAGAAVHELSQPLSGAVGHVYLMLTGEEAPDGRMLVSKEDLQATEACLRRASEILRKMQSIRRYTVTEYRDGVMIVDIYGASDER